MNKFSVELCCGKKIQETALSLRHHRSLDTSIESESEDSEGNFRILMRYMVGDDTYSRMNSKQHEQMQHLVQKYHEDPLQHWGSLNSGTDE
ncbi:hypothetical protein NPIL_422251 [Nephila pilipes]|uniref:Uncharacterized protein n=1 Tax=Nephila pilipes TaxID=299642 RepID=A0A8X6NAL5_NEPPI|nr:hypothetical protein NPIL_422251 [Nephila pilipes]